MIGTCINAMATGIMLSKVSIVKMSKSKNCPFNDLPVSASVYYLPYI